MKKKNKTFEINQQSVDKVINDYKTVGRLIVSGIVSEKIKNTKNAEFAVINTNDNGNLVREEMEFLDKNMNVLEKFGDKGSQLYLFPTDFYLFVFGRSSSYIFGKQGMSSKCE